MILKSKFTSSVSGSDKPLSSGRPSQPEVSLELPIRFCNGRALTDVNNSALSEPPFVPCDFSSERVDALSVLSICTPTNEIEAHILNVLGDKKYDAIGAF